MPSGPLDESQPCGCGSGSVLRSQVGAHTMREHRIFTIGHSAGWNAARELALAAVDDPTPLTAVLG